MVPISGSRRTRSAATATLSCLLMLAASACGGGDSAVPVPEGSSAGPAEPAPPPSTGPSGVGEPNAGSGDGSGDGASDGSGDGTGGGGGVTKVLPDLVGKGLQVAQNRTQAAGFSRMTSHDALGRKRVQILDRDWKVCFQTPAAGRRGTDTRVDFGTVKLDERCPGSDRGAEKVRAAGGVMPNLRGKSAAVAVEALGGDASISWRDGTGEDRTVVLVTNWRVCAQSPRAGAAYNGVPVTLTVVKTDERC